jgi:hypothetical protein
MSAMWYAWGNFSTIGYIRQSDRRMVDLGRITGQLGVGMVAVTLQVMDN